MIIQFENALDQDTCRRLVAAAEQALRSAPEATHYQSVRLEGEALTIVDSLAQACVRHARQHYQMNVVPTTRSISRYCPGKSLFKHADNCMLDATGAWVPSALPRLIAAFCYLNEGFVGGELLFEAQNVSIKPRPGLLVMWPGHPDYIHEVSRVESGYRYAAAIGLREMD